MARLSATYSVDGGSPETIFFDESVGISIGRAPAPTNQIVLKEQEVSNQHARLGWLGTSWWLNDTSRNGSTVAGEFVRHGPRRYVAGEVIRIGKHTLVFRTLPDLPPASYVSTEQGPSTWTIRLTSDGTFVNLRSGATEYRIPIGKNEHVPRLLRLLVEAGWDEKGWRLVQLEAEEADDAGRPVQDSTFDKRRVRLNKWWRNAAQNMPRLPKALTETYKGRLRLTADFQPEVGAAASTG